MDKYYKFLLIKTNGWKDPLKFLFLCEFKGILSTKIVIFSYPKLLSFSVLTFIKWRLTLSYVAKDPIFWQKRPKTIVIRIIVRMTIFKFIHMAFFANTSWACALFRNNKQHEWMNEWMTDSLFPPKVWRFTKQNQISKQSNIFT